MRLCSLVLSLGLPLRRVRHGNGVETVAARLVGAVCFTAAHDSLRAHRTVIRAHSPHEGVQAGNCGGYETVVQLHLRKDSRRNTVKGRVGRKDLDVDVAQSEDCDGDQSAKSREIQSQCANARTYGRRNAKTIITVSLFFNAICRSKTRIINAANRQSSMSMSKAPTKSHRAD